MANLPVAAAERPVMADRGSEGCEVAKMLAHFSPGLAGSSSGARYGGPQPMRTGTAGTMFATLVWGAGRVPHRQRGQPYVLQADLTCSPRPTRPAAARTSEAIAWSDHDAHQKQ
jgi:hypothetical protein